MKQGYYFFLWKVPTIGEVCPEIYSILPLLGRAPGGGDIFLYVTILYVMILKNSYKTKTNEARMLFFLWEVSTIKGVCNRKFTTLPLLERAPGSNYPTLPHSEI